MTGKAIRVDPLAWGYEVNLFRQSGGAPIQSSNGYQNGLCFYRNEPLTGELIHVDHVIPWAFLNHDEIWNLVLAPSRCNLEKNVRLPFRRSLQKLYERNEYDNFRI